MGVETSSELWTVRYRVADLIDIKRLIEEWFWHRLELHVRRGSYSAGGVPEPTRLHMRN